MSLPTPVELRAPVLVAPDASARSVNVHLQRAVAFLLVLLIGWLGAQAELRWRHRPTRRPAAESGITHTHAPAAAVAAAIPRNDQVSLSKPVVVDQAPDSLAIHLDTPTPGPAVFPSEAALLDRLRNLPITRVKKGAGGRTLAFKLTLEDGTQGYFKPEQTVSSANWYAEVAAYHLDRALGLGRVAPVTSRRVAWSALVKAAAGDKREPELIRDKQDSLRGAFIAWLPKKPTAVETPAGWENWVRIEPFARWAVSPYQSSAAYVAALRHVRELAARGAQAPGRYEVIPTPSSEDLPAALSDMLVFDFLTLNYDRWGGDNTNVLTLGAGGPLIFLDNGDAFSAGPSRRGLMDSRLAPVQKFRKRTIEALRKLDVVALGERLNADPNGPILDENAMAGLAVRRQAVLEHVAAQQQRFGDAVFAW